MPIDNNFRFPYTSKNEGSIFKNDPERVATAEKALQEYSNRLQAIQEKIKTEGLMHDHEDELVQLSHAGFGKEVIQIVIPAFKIAANKNWVDMDRILFSTAIGEENVRVLLDCIKSALPSLASIGITYGNLPFILQMAAKNENVRGEVFKLAFTQWKAVSSDTRAFFTKAMYECIDISTATEIFDALENFTPSYPDIVALRPLWEKLALDGEAKRTY